MCTAITLQTKDFYFGRTLDLDESYSEEVTITPRKFSFSFGNGKKLENHYAMIGMAHVLEDYPLYFDAVNEKGLAMAGLNFDMPDNYAQERAGMEPVAVFELIPWVLAQCSGVAEANTLLKKTSLTDQAFREDLPPTGLHWILADQYEAVTVEPAPDGLRIFENKPGVLTNNPSFDCQMLRLNDYLNLSPGIPENRFCPDLELQAYSAGMGALGLPGDVSSQSRFVRGAFTKLNSVCSMEEGESVGQFFHILGSVEQVRGCCRMEDGKWEMTLYTSCCNTDKGIYYYTTYGNRQITGVNMHRERLDDSFLIRYPLISAEQIRMQN